MGINQHYASGSYSGIRGPRSSHSQVKEYNPEEPEQKLAVHRCHDMTNGRKEASTHRTGKCSFPKTIELKSGKQTKDREDQPAQRERHWTHCRMCGWATRAWLCRAWGASRPGLQPRNPPALTWALHCKSAL